MDHVTVRFTETVKGGEELHLLNQYNVEEEQLAQRHDGQKGNNSTHALSRQQQEITINK